MKLKLLSLALCLSACIASPAYAKTYSTEVINNIEVGQVAIQINEYEIDKDGQETPYLDNKVVLPGQTVSKIVRVTNLGNEAWIRIKAEFDAEDPKMVLTEDNLVLADNNWKKCGEYYYYLKPVDTGGFVNFIKQVIFPTDWNESQSELWTRIKFTSDAVQRRNFKPDFDSEDPWFGTMIEQRIYQPFEIRPESTDVFSVTFENGADGFVRVGDDFFSNWETLLPGDTVTGTVTVGNHYGRAVTIFFHTETIADDDLLKQCTLTIKNGDEVIYDGPLSGTLNEVSLGRFRKGDTAVMTYTLYIPKELQNAYALTKTKTKWVWSTSFSEGGGGGSSGGGGGRGTITPEPVPPAPEVSGGPGPEPGNASPSDGNVMGDGRQPDVKGLARTGQELTFFMLIPAVVLGFAALLLRRRKEDDVK